jgi:uncharacterized protein (TIGR02996 family)
MDRRTELLAAIEANPDALDNWLVYADWLSERDDVRGELIMLELAIEAGLATDAVLARRRAILRHDEALMSPQLAEHWHHLDLEYWRGFIVRASIFGPADDPPPPDVMDALYADAHACLLRGLTLGSDGELCARAASERIRELQLGTDADTELALDAWFPRLESLELYCADDAPEELVHPTLTRLAINGACAALRTGRFDLPALTTLELEDDEDFEDDEAAIELFGRGAIFQSPPPQLVSLRLSGWSAAMAAALRDSPLLAQLRSLTCSLDSETLEQMSADRFGHLAIAATVRAYSREEHEALVARCAQVLPRLRPDVWSRHDDSPRPAPEPPPPVAANLANALSQIAERLRNRR